MQDETQKSPEPKSAAEQMLEKLNLSSRQAAVVRIVNDFVAMGAQYGLTIGVASGLTAQESIHAVKATLAALLAAYEADPGFTSPPLRIR